ARAIEEALARREEYPAPVEIIVACNGCTDRSAEIARRYPVTVVEDERCGMSFGNNLGGRAAQHDLLFFWDVDTSIAAGGLRDLAAAANGKGEVAGAFWCYPDHWHFRSWIFFFLMNQYCRWQRIPQPGTVLCSRSVYERIGGFDESIPQGTGSDLVRRALAVGAEYLLVLTRRCRTSTRRFEKRGYLRQLFEWRRNIRCHRAGNKEEIRKHPYDVIR
ncbi:MAG: glycosyltransferase, partial [Planctomycetota bacterium]|nr:glycosyltransferase [Planctomycetota bacterium]